MGKGSVKAHIAILMAGLLTVVGCSSSGGAGGTSQTSQTSTGATVDTNTGAPAEASSSSAGSQQSAPESSASTEEADDVCQGQDGSGVTIGFGNLDESVPFAVDVRNSMERVAKACGAKLASADNKTDSQVALDNARNFAVQKVQGLVWFHFDPKIGSAVCDAIGDIPVIAIDIPLAPCGVFMGADNRTAGELGGQGLGTAVKAQWNCQLDSVVTFENFNLGDVNIDRMNGQLAGLLKECPDLKLGDFEKWSPKVAGSIVTREDAFRLDPSFSTMRDFLTAHADDTHIAVLCLNSDACQGALSALVEAKRADQAMLTSQSPNEATRDLIRENPNYVGATSYAPECYGDLVIPNILRMIHGGEPTSNPLLMQHVFLNKDNIDDYYPKGEPVTCHQSFSN